MFGFATWCALATAIVVSFASAYAAPLKAVPASRATVQVQPLGTLVNAQPEIYVLDAYMPGYITHFTGIEGANYVKREGSLANQGLWVDRNGNIYMARYNGPTGTGLDRFGPAGNGPTTYADGLSRVQGVALDSKNRIYVIDADLNQVIRIDNMAGDNRVAFGRLGSYLGEFKNPCGIFVDSHDRIYVADIGNQRIVRFDDMAGNGWTVYTGMQHGGVGGQVNFPWTVWVDQQDRMYYLRPERNAICRVDDMAGNGYVSYGFDNPADRKHWLVNPQGVAVDRDGRIYIADQDRRLVMRIDDMTGANQVEYFQTEGQPAFRRPSRIFVGYPRTAQ